MFKNKTSLLLLMLTIVLTFAVLVLTTFYYLSTPDLANPATSSSLILTIISAVLGFGGVIISLLQFRPFKVSSAPSQNSFIKRIILLAFVV